MKVLLVVTLFLCCFTTVAFSYSTGATVGIYPANFRVSVNATTVNSNYSIQLQDNFGTLNVRGKNYAALAYWTQVMDVFNQTEGVWWINVVGVAEDSSDLAIVYLDCTNNVLHPAFWEEDWGTYLRDYVIDQSDVGQSCSFELTDFPVPVAFPSLNVLPGSPYNTGITITGKTINFSGSTGWMIYNNKNFSISAISTVNCNNCKSNCGNYNESKSERDRIPEKYGCATGPWYEIHHSALLPSDSSSVPDTICFGIFYLFLEDPTFVQWNYTFCLPEVSSPMEILTANWKGTLLTNEPQIQNSPFLGTHTNFDGEKRSTFENIKKQTKISQRLFGTQNDESTLFQETIPRR